MGRYVFALYFAGLANSCLTCPAGPGYRSDEVFNLRTMEPYSLKTLYTEYSLFTNHIVLYLPRTSDVRQLAKLVEDGEKAPVVHYCMEGASKALCIYYGGFNL
jgi:trimethylguanosine synthase